MSYHIDTGLIKDKFKEDCECPLCEIKKIIEEQFLYEFLNDAVMEDNARIKVGKTGFCERHFDMLFSRRNKLSVALQIGTRAQKISATLSEIPKSAKSAKKLAAKIKNSLSGCAICELVDESMVKYYKTVAQLFARETGFIKTVMASKGFCLTHYAELLEYSGSAGYAAKEYIEVLSNVMNKNFTRLQTELKVFCDKHDYRNANEPLGEAETALPRIREKFYGKKYD